MFSFNVRYSQTVPLLVALCSLAGCGGDGGVSPVSGVVTLDGSPYPNAQVRFVPSEGRPSIGTTDESGAYKLTYLREVKGAMPGDYKVDITTVYASGSDRDGGKEPPEKLPAKYNTKSELKETVVAGVNTINFELKTK